MLLDHLTTCSLRLDPFHKKLCKDRDDLVEIECLFIYRSIRPNTFRPVVRLIPRSASDTFRPVVHRGKLELAGPREPPDEESKSTSRRGKGSVMMARWNFCSGNTTSSLASSVL